MEWSGSGAKGGEWIGDNQPRGVAGANGDGTTPMPLITNATIAGLATAEALAGIADWAGRDTLRQQE
jgi:hypothetical protein